jgi:hypothetical protein
MPTLTTTKITFGVSAAAALALLAGCGNTAVFPDTTSAGAAFAMNGKIHGGQQPVTGSHVHLMQAASSAYGAASTSLLTANGTTVLTDAIGGYVATDANGNFGITGTYSCTAGSQVYILATQGNPGLAAGTNNTGIGLMAGLGVCPQGGSLLTAVPNIFVDEVSTVATAFALAGFFTDATHLATNGSAGATTGINNAAANIAAISSITGGHALAVTPNGKGTVPQAELNVLANVLATCINSTGSGCTTLFANAKNGATLPTETATAAINIAHNPGANVAALYGTQSSTSPFQPTLTAAPADFSVRIDYTPATAQFTGTASNNQGTIAIDAAGNVWGPAAGQAAALELSPLGATLNSIKFTPGANSQYRPLNISVSPAGTIWAADYSLAYALPNATVFTPANDGSASWAGTEQAVSFDTANNAWTANNYPASLGTIGASGTVTAASAGGFEPSGFAPSAGKQYPSNVFLVAVDSNNDVWGVCSTCNAGTTGVVAEITNSGTAISGTGGDTPSTFVYPSGIAIDSSNNAWITDFNTGLVTKYNSANVNQNTAGYPSSPLPNSIYGITIDGSSNVWLGGGNGATSGVLFSLNNAGTLTSPAAGYQSQTGVTYYKSSSVATDGSGNIWILDNNGGLHVTLGIATPVVVPVTPSALGKRP